MNSVEPAQTEPTAARQKDTRRNLLRKTGMAIVGAGALFATGEMLTAQPAAAILQSGWRYCSRCKSMVHLDGQAHCAAGQYHNTSGSWLYVVDYNLSPTPSGYQGLWRWCSRCNSLFYSGYDRGTCTDTTHNQGGTNYFLTTVADPGRRQPGWRYCRSCRCLNYGPNVATSWCFRRGYNHDNTGSWNYHVLASTP
jgi:hypothetical protein